MTRLPAPHRVLIIKPSSLGDVVSAITLPAGLKRTFPHVHVSWLVVPSCADILRGQPKIDELIIFDRKRFGRIGRSVSATGGFWRFCRELRQKKFDWVIDLQGLFRSGFLSRVSGAEVRAGFSHARELAGLFYTHHATVEPMHVVEENLHLAWDLGVDARTEDFRLSILPEAAAAADALLAEKGLKPKGFIVAVPGARWPNKMYPVEHWRTLLGLLDRPVALVGAPGEEELCGQVAEGLSNVANLAGRTSLPQLAAVISRASAVICGDSAANFIAPAVGTPNLELIGPTDPLRTGPFRTGKAVVAELPCQGCLRRRCLHKPARCMAAIQPQRVAEALGKLLSPVQQSDNAQRTNA